MFDDYSAMRLRWALVFGVLIGACTKPNPASCLDDFCDDPALPFCDVDGSIGGVPDTCIAVDCEPNTFESCTDETHARLCSTDGRTFVTQECEFGCGDDGCLPCNTAECQPTEQHIIPKYLGNACDDVASSQLAMTQDLTIDTSIDTNCTAIVSQSNGPDMCVIHHESVTIGSTSSLTFTGPRVVALIADRTFDVRGVVNASASRDVNTNTVFNGPGGGFKKSGTGNDVPGGGAGYRTRGGHGGSNGTDGGQNNGGPPELAPTELTRLLGGTQAARTTTNGQPGGGGGGVTMICCRCTLSISGMIHANGGGGSAPPFGGNPLGLVGKAGGGGSGGTIVLQGLGIELTGRAFANGGGGGSGATSTFQPGNHGADGPLATTCAEGGTPGNGGAGGNGGCDLPSGDGKAFAGSNSFTPGAGGGSAGFILTYTPEGVTPLLTPIANSPPLTANGVIPTN